jgi:hypothetical protein
MVTEAGDLLTEDGMKTIGMVTQTVTQVVLAVTERSRDLPYTVTVRFQSLSFIQPTDQPTTYQPY